MPDSRRATKACPTTFDATNPVARIKRRVSTMPRPGIEATPSEASRALSTSHTV
jgi:hypothetical protein